MQAVVMNGSCLSCALCLYSAQYALNRATHQLSLGLAYAVRARLLRLVFITGEIIVHAWLGPCK